jgi:hypothetical protein
MEQIAANLYSICQDYIYTGGPNRLPIHHQADLFTITFANGVEETLLYIEDAADVLDQDAIIDMILNNGLNFSIEGTRAGQGNRLTSRLVSRQEGDRCVVQQFDLFAAQENENAATYEDHIPLGMRSA